MTRRIDELNAYLIAWLVVHHDAPTNDRADRKVRVHSTRFGSRARDVKYYLQVPGHVDAALQTQPSPTYIDHGEARLCVGQYEPELTRMVRVNLKPGFVLSTVSLVLASWRIDGVDFHNKHRIGYQFMPIQHIATGVYRVSYR